MVVAAAEEESGKLCDDRGDAYCGMLNGKLQSVSQKSQRLISLSILLEQQMK